MATANTVDRLTELKNRLFELETTIVYTFQEQRDRNREMFVISAEIEKLTNPTAYAENNAHWENHELRF